MRFTPVPYASLNARQKENYNFHHLAARLSEYGYHAIPLSDDWNGADLIAVHVADDEVLRVQLKGRLTIAKKYLGRGLYVAFRDGGLGWVIYPHDAVAAALLDRGDLGRSASWGKRGAYSFPTLSSANRALLTPYRLPAVPSGGLVN